MERKIYPVTVVPIDIDRAKEMADMVAAYFRQLIAANIPDELARQLTLEWQDAYLKNHGVITIESGT